MNRPRDWGPTCWDLTSMILSRTPASLEDATRLTAKSTKFSLRINQQDSKFKNQTACLQYISYRWRSFRIFVGKVKINKDIYHWNLFYSFFIFQFHSLFSPRSSTRCCLVSAFSMPWCRREGSLDLLDGISRMSSMNLICVSACVRCW